MSDPFAMDDPGNPDDFPVGSRVRITTAMEDFHFFRDGDTGTVTEHTGHRHLGLIVRLDRPFGCDHGHYKHVVEDFNFSPSSVELLAATPTPENPR